MIKHLLAALTLCLASFSVMAGDELIDINTADAATIAAEVKGIGEVKAQAIVEYRQQHGRYDTVDELANVKGVGDKTVDKIRDQVTVSSMIDDSE